MRSNRLSYIRRLIRSVERTYGTLDDPADLTLRTQKARYSAISTIVLLNAQLQRLVDVLDHINLAAYDGEVPDR